MGMGSSVIGPTNMDVSVPVIRPSSGHRWAMCSLPTANLGSVGALRQGDLLQPAGRVVGVAQGLPAQGAGGDAARCVA